jgi:hypothetical protein
MFPVSYYVYIWAALGLINYFIKFVNYRADWKKKGSRVFFIAILIGSVLFGPIGLLSTLIQSKGKPIMRKKN